MLVEKELNFGNVTIRRWNINSPSVDKVLEVANYFNMSIEYLLREKEDKQVKMWEV